MPEEKVESLKAIHYWIDQGAMLQCSSVKVHDFMAC